VTDDYDVILGEREYLGDGFDVGELGRGQIDYPYHALGYVDNENRTLYINN
jgi:hypothetical protein